MYKSSVLDRSSNQDAFTNFLHITSPASFNTRSTQFFGVTWGRFLLERAIENCPSTDLLALRLVPGRSEFCWGGRVVEDPI